MKNLLLAVAVSLIACVANAQTFTEKLGKAASGAAGTDIYSVVGCPGGTNQLVAYVQDMPPYNTSSVGVQVSTFNDQSGFSYDLGDGDGLWSAASKIGFSSAHSGTVIVYKTASSTIGVEKYKVNIMCANNGTNLGGGSIVLMGNS